MTDVTGPQAASAPPQGGSDADWQAAQNYYQSVANTGNGSPLPHMAPQSGPALDTIWGSLKDAGGRILSKTGFALSNNLQSVQVSPEEHQALVNAGVFNDYNDSHKNFVRSAAESLLRPAIHIANAIGQIPAIPSALTAGVGALSSAVGEEIEGAKPNAVQQAVAAPFKAGGELATGVSEGALLGEGVNLTEEASTARATGVAARESENLAAATKGRALGALGEGEAGYYDAAPLKPEDIQARAESAQEAGIEVPPPQPPPDIHELARRVDPETFQQFDALAAERDAHRQTIANLGAERENSPEALTEQQNINTILGRVNGVEDRLTKAGAQRLADAQERLNDILTRDTPEMAEARSKLMDADFAMRDLAPDVSDAYRQAADMAPHLAEEDALGGAEQATKASEGAESPVEKGGAEQPHIDPAAVEASSEAAGLKPPSVTGDEKLGATAEGNGSGAAEPSAATTDGNTESAPSSESVKLADSRYGNLKAVEGTGDLKTRGLAEGVEAKAIEDGLTTNFGDLPEYRQLNMAEQAAAVSKLMDADYEGAKAIAMGDKQPPKGILPESVYVGVEKRALAEGDVDTLQKLATRSKLTTSATTMGQRIRTLGERDKASPVGMIQEVQAAREADLARRTGDVAEAKKAAVKEIRDEVKKTASKPDAWTSFIRSITCGSE